MPPLLHVLLLLPLLLLMILLNLLLFLLLLMLLFFFLLVLFILCFLLLLSLCIVHPSCCCSCGQLLHALSARASDLSKMGGGVIFLGHPYPCS